MTPSPARARTTATAGKGSPPGRRSRRAGGARAVELAGDEAVWRLEATYLALGLVGVVSVLSPERIVLGGGVMQMPGLLQLVRAEVERLLGGYVAAGEIVPPALGARSGVLGAIALAERR